jgi:hypothetical protein
MKRGCTAKYLIRISWTFWGGLFLLLMWGFVQVLVEESPGPEVSSRALGIVVLGFSLVVFAGVGGWLLWATRHRSTAALVVLTLLLSFPVVVLIASPVVRVWETWRFEHELASVGDFPDPASRALAEKIRSGDVSGIQRLLGDGPPPDARDQAGNDLLAFAAAMVRDENANPESVRILLEAGADPGESRTSDGGNLLHFMVLDRAPSSVEVVRLLLEYGADPNAVDPESGVTPMALSGARPDMVRLLTEAGADIDQLLPGGESMLVRFISMQQWDSALFLIQRGAKLDVTNPDGLSVDYYLREFRDSVYGQHPEGWDRVRAAVHARRNGTG